MSAAAGSQSWWMHCLCCCWTCCQRCQGLRSSWNLSITWMVLCASFKCLGAVIEWVQGFSLKISRGRGASTNNQESRNRINGFYTPASKCQCLEQSWTQNKKPSAGGSIEHVTSLFTWGHFWKNIKMLAKQQEGSGSVISNRMFNVCRAFCVARRMIALM